MSSSKKKDRKLKQIKLKPDFENIKSKYILKIIFDYLGQNRLLEILRYNKKLQNKLNVNINNYIEYSKLFSAITIELNLIDNNFSKFINIPKNEKKYYHIYFDNSNNEIKRNHLEKNDKVKMIKIKIDHQVKSFKELFCNCNCISSIFFKRFYRTNIIDMSYMFYLCSKLKELNTANFKTSNVTTMSHMFTGCSSLKKLNLSNFDTEQVTDMYNMFLGCSLLKELNLSRFNTSNVIDMSFMFSECSSLDMLNISNFNTNNVINMTGMFSKCASLKELNLSNFNTDKVISMNRMFSECSALKGLNISNFKTNNTTNMNDMFYRCSRELIKNIQVQDKNIQEIFKRHLCQLF